MLNFAINTNPVHKNVEISYFLPETAQMKFKVWDTEGTLKFTAVLGTFTNGAGIINVELPELIPGIYFAVLETSEDNFVKRRLYVGSTLN